MINYSSLKNISKTIRGLSIDAINKANSGHPGLPMGCAEIITTLFTHHLKFNSKNPNWINRDKFILSAGHGSMLQYTILHLTGYPISLNDIKNFRQLHSITAGHPEYDTKIGIETTTGPLGQGIGHSVGLSIASKMAAARCNTKDHSIIDNNIYCLAGDGCLMEGVSSEACSIAGHLELDNLVVIYDSNDICLDGPTSECFTEQVQTRFKAYNWHTITVNGHDFDELNNAFIEAKNATLPTIIIAKTKIGFGSPNREGSSESHGKPLGEEETNLTKKALNIPLEPEFYIPEDVTNYFLTHQKKQQAYEDNWNTLKSDWKQSSPEKHTILNELLDQTSVPNLEDMLNSINTKPNIASRASSQTIIQQISKEHPFIVGGSADLSCSDSTFIKDSHIISKDNFNEKNIKYGAREFAMATIATGLSLSGFFKPFIGTFLTFSDYMKNAIRLTALIKKPVIYQFTHDSIFLGEDGPTHQPIEHLSNLRSTPGLTVIRPADATEVKGAWFHALNTQRPTAIILSRQGLKDLDNTSIQETQKGAYILKKSAKNNQQKVTIFATGSEVSLALDVASQLEKEQISIDVISFPSWELFELQTEEYKNSILNNDSLNIVIEAQSSFGWHKYTSKTCLFYTVDTFGHSAKAADIANYLGLTTESITKNIFSHIKNNSHNKVKSL